ncbi:hypothetical protein RFI_21355 [Reticulomyxa filosa]|uniref:Uncharacterized protein n=1 Tax=Reticulomyxa filosa TaxID=46433 RepID=X6MSD7_RETFI|nr:hypothetical protein RFI_21355 [Reticulomyxa filosa]|eukprot:ETO16010.1 hypothetical protein RFI_21355 [Reticulomyxa filosa]
MFLLYSFECGFVIVFDVETLEQTQCFRVTEESNCAETNEMKCCVVCTKTQLETFVIALMKSNKISVLTLTEGDTNKTYQLIHYLELTTSISQEVFEKDTKIQENVQMFPLNMYGQFDRIELCRTGNLLLVKKLFALYNQQQNFSESCWLILF